MADNTYQNRDSQLDTSGNIVGFYEREFYIFSNFSSFEVEWKGRIWKTSEHAYQASHFFETAPELVEEIFNAKSAHDAFKIAKLNSDKAPKNWEEIKVSIMEDIIRHKLEQNPYIKHKLIQTGDKLIVEDSPKDNCWGWGPNKDGRNDLGKIWMKLREEITKNQNTEPGL
ncbi:MAG TPA: NADAR family protein [Patescibacteria group bacterium]